MATPAVGRSVAETCAEPSLPMAPSMDLLEAMGTWYGTQPPVDDDRSTAARRP